MTIRTSRRQLMLENYLLLNAGYTERREAFAAFELELGGRGQPKYTPENQTLLSGS